jgi:serine protease inhibitor
MKKIISIFIAIIVLSLFSGCVNLDTNKELDTNEGEKQTVFDLTKINSQFVEGNGVFAFNIFKEINKEEIGKNIFISPFSISTALAMTYNGARGNTAQIMADTLQYKKIGLEGVNLSYKNLLPYLNNIDPKILLDINNSIWFRKGEEIKPDFLQDNKSNFNAHIGELDFQEAEAADIMNDWISDATKGKIDKMIDPPISEHMIMYLINAIYFKGEWTEQFKKEHTFTGSFNKENGEVQDVQMMSRVGKIEYGQVDDAKIVRLPYGDEKVSMYCILPEEGTGVDDYIEKLSIDKWKELQDSLIMRGEVFLNLPRFKIDFGIKRLNSSLIALGMGEAFGNLADFSGIRDDVCISEVLHKAVIEVNEEGSEAAAATVVGIKATSAMKPIEFIADRPFIFLITDDETGTIIFMGKLLEVS